uniref:Uncharacterized protein n=1 Tax=Daphnia magna TaxID=35525 RepID=A0A0P5U687_9CRUS
MCVSLYVGSRPPLWVSFLLSPSFLSCQKVGIRARVLIRYLRWQNVSYFSPCHCVCFVFSP